MVGIMEIKEMIVRCNHLKKAVFHGCLILLVLVLSLSFTKPALAQVDYDAQIKAIQKEKSSLEADKQELSNTIKVLRSLLDAAQSQRNSLGKNHSSATRKVGELRGKLRRLDQQIARLASPYDLAMALEKYKESGRTEEAFIEFYKTAKGKQPDHATLSNYTVHAHMIEREIRVKVALPLAKGLVLIGKIITDTFKFMRADMAMLHYDVTKGAEMLFRGPQDAFTKRGAIAEFISKVRNQCQRIDKLRAYSSLTAMPREKAAQILGPQLKGVLGGLVEYQKYLLPDAVTVIENCFEDFEIPFTEYVGGTEKGWKQGKQMLDESERMANLSLYGTADRAKALKLAKETRNELIPKLRKAEEALAALETPLQNLNQSIADLEDSIKLIEDEYQQIDFFLEVFESDKQKLIVDRDLAKAKRQTAALGPKVHLSSFSLAFGNGKSISLAADSLTARSLGIQEWIPYTTPASLFSIGDHRCEYDCRTVKDNKTGNTTRICKHAIRHHIPTASTKVDDYRKVTVESTQGKVKIDSKKRIISGYSPGKDEVYASAVVTKLKRVNHECGWENQVTGKQEQTPQKTPFTVLKVVDARYWGISDFEMNTRSIDFFESAITGDWRGGAGKTSSVITPGVVLAGREDEFSQSVRGDNFVAYLKSGGDGISFSKDRAHVKLGGSHEPGKAVIQMGLRDGDGELLFPRQLTVTSNIVNAQTEMPDLIPERFSHSLPIGEEAVLQVTVTGGADMRRYEIRWSAYHGEKGTHFTKSTNFVRRGRNRWVSQNKISFTKERITGDLGSFTLRTARQAMDLAGLGLRAHIVRKEDGMLITVLHPPVFYPLPPRLDNFEFAKIDPGTVPAAQIDLFFPTTLKTYGRIGLDGEFMAGIRETLLFNFVDLQKIGYSAGIVSIARSGEITTSYAGSKDVGSTELIASLDFATAQRQRGMLLTKDIIQDFLTITINKITAAQRGEEEEAKSRLMVYGPANMTGFKARWSFQDGIQGTTAFTFNQGQWISEHPADKEVFASSRLIKVDVLNRAGMIVGTYEPKSHGALLPPPRMKLSMPAKRKPGSAVSVSALIENLYSKDAGDFVCRWEIDPSFGELQPKESTVKAVMPFERNRGFCKTVFKAADNPEVAGKQAPIRVRLFRVIGGNKGL
jgi:predicted  nucleic acid-binding Zn-ribbon protein